MEKRNTCSICWLWVIKRDELPSSVLSFPWLIMCPFCPLLFSSFLSFLCSHSFFLDSFFSCFLSHFFSSVFSSLFLCHFSHFFPDLFLFPPLFFHSFPLLLYVLLSIAPLSIHSLFPVPSSPSHLHFLSFPFCNSPWRHAWVPATLINLIIKVTPSWTALPSHCAVALRSCVNTYTLHH